MLPSNLADDCDDCVPDYLRQSRFGTKAAFSSLPFLATFAVVTLVAYRKVYPLLSNDGRSQAHGKSLPRPVTASELPSQTLARRIAALTFSTTIASSTVLTELLLCEISNSFNAAARSVALQITITGLLGLLVVAIPLLGIYSVVSKSGYTFRGEKKGRLRLAWVLEFGGYATFLFGFWLIGTLLPEPKTISETVKGREDLFQACLDRLGLTGVSLMALLSGFASVSAIWHAFGPKAKAVSEADISRKQAGLDATEDMLSEKRTRLNAIENKISSSPKKTLWSNTMGMIRGNADVQERQTLEMEISGLQTMAASLSSTLTIMRDRRTSQLRATTASGQIGRLFAYSFSCYCVYRIVTTTINIFKRMITSNSQQADTDPITYAIAIFARHFYPSLDQQSWAQQISFLLSGIMLLASFSAVTQTFHLFTRFMPSLLQATQSNFALLISQISGMYVISSALMLRGMMPKEVGSVINGALGAGLLDPAWTQKWFDGFFMLSVLSTTFGVFMGRQFQESNYWDDDAGSGGMELGKRS